MEFEQSEYFNKRHLVAPAVCSIESENSPDQISRLRLKLADCCIKVADMEAPIVIEQQILRKMIYKYVGPFRREKILTVLKKVSKCLDKFKALNTRDYLQTLVDVMNHSDDQRLPSLPMMIHILDLLAMGSMCLHIIVRTCLHGYSLVQKKFKAGAYVPTMLLFSAMLARIWFVNCGLLKEFVQLYDWLMQQIPGFSSWERNSSQLAEKPKSIKHLSAVDGFSGLLQKKEDNSAKRPIASEKNSELFDYNHSEDCNVFAQDLENIEKLSEEMDTSVKGEKTDHLKKPMQYDELHFLTEDLGVSIERSPEVADLMVSRKNSKKDVRTDSPLQNRKLNTAKECKASQFEEEMGETNVKGKRKKQNMSKNCEAKTKYGKKDDSLKKRKMEEINTEDLKGDQTVNDNNTMKSKVVSTPNDIHTENERNLPSKGSNSIIEKINKNENEWILKKSLLDFVLSVYTKKKVQTRLKKSILKSNARLKFTDCDIILGASACQKVINKLKSAEKLGQSGSFNAETRAVAAKKLFKRLKKYIV